MPHPLSTSVTRALRQQRWSPADARIVFEAIATSGLSIAQFAREYKADYQRLNSWRRRLAAATTAESPIAFVQLGAASLVPATPPRYEIVLATGESLRIEGAVDTASVGALLALLRGERPC